MANIGHIIVFSLLGGVVSLLGGLLILSRKKHATKLAHYATPFAAGALLAAVFLDLLKEGIETARPETVLLSTLIGMLLFFFAERFLHWFHHHHPHKGQKDPSISLIIVGDTVHNALDGVAIAASFLVSVPTGIVTTLAVAAHEIPQEIGDFGLLLNKGMKRRQVLAVNLISAVATVAAAVLTFALGDADNLPIGVILGLSAGFLLYVAASDIIPEIHERASKRRLFDWQPVLLLVGVAVVGLSIQLAHQHIDAGHEHQNTADHSVAEKSHSHAPTEGIEIANHDIVPTVHLELTPDTMGGYNLHIETTNFRFAPENVNQRNRIGEGHAHVNVNGEKYLRVYSGDVHLADVTEGDTVEVTLNANNHRLLTHDGESISANVAAEAGQTRSEARDAGTEDHPAPDKHGH